MKDKAMLLPTSVLHFRVCKELSQTFNAVPSLPPNDNDALRLKPGKLGFSSIQVVGEGILELRCNWTLKNWVMSQRGLRERRAFQSIPESAHTTMA